MYRFIVKKIVGYHGQFRVPELDFNEKWGNINTPEYDILATEVGTEVYISTCSFVFAFLIKSFRNRKNTFYFRCDEMNNIVINAI